MIEIKEQIVKAEVVHPKQVEDTPLPAKRKSLKKLPRRLPAARYKFKTPHSEHAYYVKITHCPESKRLTELFINTKDVETEFMLKFIGRAFSALCREIDNPLFLAQEMKEMHDPAGGYWDGQFWRGSILSTVAACIYEEAAILGLIPEVPQFPKEAHGYQPEDKPKKSPTVSQCASCSAHAVIHEGGCDRCLECGHSTKCKG